MSPGQIGLRDAPIKVALLVSETADRAIGRALADEADRRSALVPETEGIGSGMDVTVAAADGSEWWS